jgi:hypothetical protein
LHDLHQRIDVATDETAAGFHALNGGQGQLGASRKDDLLDAKQRTRSMKLRW